MAAYLPLEDYGLIGNLHTVALVSKVGSLDYLPFTRFDSPTIFAALLDAEKGGSWVLQPTGAEVRSKQLYLPDTGVLLTRFFTGEGIAELTDFMPVKRYEQNCAVVRTVRVVKGAMEFRMQCAPRFDYARTSHQARPQPDGSILFKSDGPDGFQFRLLGNQPFETTDPGDAGGCWRLEAGETASFVIEATPTSDPNFIARDLAHYTEAAFADTLRFWREWVESSTYTGRWRETVLRSAITLKLLTSLQYGSTVAAATFSLPEAVGGVRNWDYRYTWIRDAAFTMYAFLRLGFMQESKAFLRWIMDRCVQLPEAGDLQLMYAVDGTSDLPEQELDHLSGYRDSRPVRIGNGASRQFQLDIYGELLDTIYLYNKYGGAITYDFWQHVCRLVNYVAENWRRPDHGIWEVRDEDREFLSGKMMCWVALDRGIRIARDRSFPAPLVEWHRIRDEIYQEVYEHYWSEQRQSFVQSRGSAVLDASVLLLPLIRMFSPAEPRWQATMRTLEQELLLDSLMFRYRTEHGATDGLTGEEGTFTMCSFWYIENLSRGGEVDKARLLFEKLLGFASPLGLYSEQIGPQGEQIGNYPQAFTHLALISAAFQLNRDLDARHEGRAGGHQFV
ncbi:GH15 family glucan-1,4-alpha-glucosidase [Hymenobacter luteus]|uniref:GH15 family glucan-1,4-alpha-glucosidase n=2 Tax=Hymenobacter TaxID=89966 RepID=A0A7W9T123_9BACT|nr:MULTISPECIES: glycoside hydrolase family 15 protein [Hymenobacter]MBB4602100.1 GH15 family glucan-1,4-alpha-glucosidase [Hymenobacter latericoloratus]MBB6059471.1 GH15 family glucan-1,4-alpha-glucosidase [Hymenobacter luteus]